MNTRVELVTPSKGSLLPSNLPKKEIKGKEENPPPPNNTNTPYLGQDIANAAISQVSILEDPLIDIEDRLPQKIALDNGLTIIADEIPNAKSCFASMWVNAGSIHEDERNNGVAHFVEHMLFRGTKTKTNKDIKNILRKVGGKVNAFTDQEHTFYHAEVLPKDSLKILELFLDMLFNQNIDEKKFSLEKDVVLQEIKKYKDSPEDHIGDLLYESVWKGHPMGRPIIGTNETVSNMKREDLLNFIDRFYTPDNVTISIAGRFDLEKVKELADKYTKNISRRKKEVDIPEPIFKPRVLIENRRLEQTYLIFSTKGVKITDKDRFALNVIDSALCTGWSKLFDEIREERGLTYTVDSKTETDALGGIFGVYVEIPGEDIETVLEIILKEIEDVKQNGLKEEDLEDAKLQLLIEMIFDSDKPEEAGESNAIETLYHNRFIPLSEVVKSYQAVTNENIKRVANELFKPEYFNLVVIGPRKELPKRLASSFRQRAELVFQD